ncbi:retropepsin-like protein [Gossypium australe]|uniref:Retropepsin-like protein n=1 Tax=Gossypium australe TaxID=47621 RepID=A0A5B6WTJ5_9ROSI|nr:retropepsin-like protein [Gossypium australe]
MNPNELEKEAITQKEPDVQSSQVEPRSLEIPPPFPEKLAITKKVEEEGILETFHKVEVKIPLLNSIKQMPSYAEFLKELCTNKKKLKGYKKISMGSMFPIGLCSKDDQPNS